MLPDEIGVAGSPPAPILISPGADHILQGPSVTFTWEARQGTPEVTSFRVCIAEADQSCSQPGAQIYSAIPATARSFTPPDGLPLRFQGKHLQWSVAACAPNRGPTTVGGSEESCTYARPRALVWPLPPPILSSPLESVPFRPNFRWFSVVGAAYYLFCISKPGVACTTQPTDSPDTLVVERQSTYYMPPNDQVLQRFAGQTVHWTVAACNAEFGCVYQQQVKAISFPPLPSPQPLPAAPTLLHPTEGHQTLSRRQTFSWQPVPGAVTYKLCVSPPGVACGSSGSYEVPALATTTYAVNLPLWLGPAGTQLHWTVAACNATGQCTYQQQVRSLTIGPETDVYSAYTATEVRATELWCGNRDWRGRDVPCTSKATSRGGEMRSRVVEVRGWLLTDPIYTFVNVEDKVDENEVLLDLLLDWGWEQQYPASEHAWAVNTPERINQSITPHNIIHFGVDSSGIGSTRLTQSVWGGSRAAVVHVEINGWGPSITPGRKRPLPTTPLERARFEGWVTSASAPPGKERVLFPFDPFHPPSANGDTALSAGDYVRMVGMLWEDEPHVTDGGNGRDEGKDAKGCWKDGPHDLGDWGRGFFEIHPVDYLAILAPPEHTDALEMFAICGNGTLDRMIRPAGPRPRPNASIGYVEHVDTSFSFSQSYNSDRVTVLNDGIRVHVTVGDGDRRGKKFKAAYHVFWQE
jgi:hypothetical protein